MSLETRVKTSLGESLANRRAYNPIRDSGETLGKREKSRQVSFRESHIYMAMCKTLSENRFFTREGYFQKEKMENIFLLLMRHV